jgi:glycosyltransferase involved in cell wall biosynthesis
MRIVHVEDFFIPLAGYQTNLLAKLQAQEGHDVIIVASDLNKIPGNYTSFFGKDPSNDEKYSNLTGVTIIRVPILGFYSGRSIYGAEIFRLIDRLQPDIVFVHGVDTLVGIQFLLRRSKLKYPLILDSHMIEIASINKFRKIFRFFYRKVVTPIILKYDIAVIRVVDVDYVEKCLSIPLSRTVYLPLGTDTHLFAPNNLARQDFRRRNEIAEHDYVVIYAGKLDQFKNGKFLAKSLLDKFDIQACRLVFVVIGNAEGSYGEEVESLFRKSQNRIIRIPTQEYVNLASFYQSADLAIFPAQCSLSFFDVQSCGVPVLLEAVEVNRQRTAHGNGYTFIPGDISDLRSKIIYCATLSNAEKESLREKSRSYVVTNFDFIPVAQKITDLMCREILKFKKEIFGD